MALRKKDKAEKRGSAIRLIVKSNNLVEARYMMNIWETRVFLTLLSMISENDEPDRVYRVWYSDIKNKFGLRSNASYNDLRKGAIGLTQKNVYLDWTTDDDFDRQFTTRLVEGVDTLKPGQENKKGVEKQQYVDLKLGGSIRPHLLEIKKHLLSNDKMNKETFNKLGVSGYTSYDMRNVIKLKPYSIRLFEILKKHQKYGFWTVEVDRFKKMFMIEEEYKRFVHFFQAVVERAVNDINEYTDITVFDIEKVKMGRKIGRLKFYFRNKSREEVVDLHRNNEEAKTEKKKSITKLNGADILYQEFEGIIVKKFGVTPTVFLKMLGTKHYNKEHIEQAIAVTRRAKYNQEIKKSVAGFFVSALKAGFTDEKIEKEKKKKIVEKKKKETTFLEAQIEELQIKKQKMVNQIISKLTAEDPKITIEAIEAVKLKTKFIIDAKEAKLGTSLTIENFRNDKILRELVKLKIIELNPNHFTEAIQEIDASLKELEAKVRL